MHFVTYSIFNNIKITTYFVFLHKIHNRENQMAHRKNRSKQMKLGSITNRKRSEPHGSKPKRYCFSGVTVFENHKVVVQSVKQTLAPYSGMLVILSCSR